AVRTACGAVLTLTRGVRSMLVSVVQPSKSLGNRSRCWVGSLSGLGQVTDLAFCPLPTVTFTWLLTRSHSDLILVSFLPPEPEPALALSCCICVLAELMSVWAVFDGVLPMGRELPP